jgi:hypothetical protein
MPAMVLSPEGNTRGLAYSPTIPLRDVMTKRETTLETDICAGAVSALRRRAMLQADRARVGVSITEGGIVIRTGEAAIAHRTAKALAALADEIERDIASIGHAAP